MRSAGRCLDDICCDPRLWANPADLSDISRCMHSSSSTLIWSGHAALPGHSELLEIVTAIWCIIQTRSGSVLMAADSV